MKEKEYLEFLKLAPPHDSPYFLDFLRDNNVVVWEFLGWLVIENKKYHTRETEWHTAFWKDVKTVPNLDLLLVAYKDHEWLKKSTRKQTVPKRFHIHLIKRK